ncbi:MAG: type IV secretion system DNA-binding domain-containing protein [Candidatus Parcubacteria bacterium]|nr:type IV secretion system DNA-binding domain-containing protein [Candidatus Parcubacteria bacterium]
MAEKTEINFFAETTFRNARKKFGIKTDDRRRHMYVVGKTGMGKTNMLVNMAIQDITAGHGMAFIDPHGEAAEEILAFIPKERVKDVVYFNPSDFDFPIAFNIMEEVAPQYRHLVAGGLMGVFKKIWPDVWSARMEYILNNCILALLEYPGSTLLGVNRMLSDLVYRKKVIDKVTDPVVKAFWTQEFARYTQRYEVEATAAIQNKIGQFISAPLIRNIVGQEKTKLDMRKIMDTEKIFIINLSKGKVGEDNSRLLGALVVTKLQLAAMSRVDMPEKDRKDFYLYVDEFQNFATESFANILSEARKYRLTLILTHQYITQMDETVRDAVFGNVGTLVTFRVGADDAEFLEREFTPDFLAADLVNLGKYNIYLKLMIDGLAGRPFSAETLKPMPKPDQSYEKEINESSREKYGTPRKIVDEYISDWAGVSDASAEKSAQTKSQEPRSPGLPQSFFGRDIPEEPQHTLYDAQCSKCGKSTKVVFQPDGVRPVYCKPCRKKIENEKEEGRRIPPPEIAPRTPPVSLKEAIEKGAMSFRQQRQTTESHTSNPKGSGPDLNELKKAIGESLDKEDSNKKRKNNGEKKGFIAPGETVKF